MSEEQYIPKWANEIPKGLEISYHDGLCAGKYGDLFDEYIYECSSTGNIRYFLFDPVKHGAEPKKNYPLIVFFHGPSNSLDEKMCVSYSGAEYFASPEYQEKMGGAYILVPLSNEERMENGGITGMWSRPYLAPIYNIITEISDKYSCGKKIALGGSMGGWFTWRICEEYPIFSGIMPVSTNYVSPKDKLEMFREKNISVNFILGLHDEFIDYRDIESKLSILKTFDNVHCWFPRWVKNADGGVASINVNGVEMGQHCVMVQVQSNLIDNEGTPYDEQLPEGVTGWIKKIVNG